MSKEKAIAALMALAAQLEKEEAKVLELDLEEGGSLSALTVVVSGGKEIGQILED